MLIKYLASLGGIMLITLISTNYELSTRPYADSVSRAGEYTNSFIIIQKDGNNARLFVFVYL